MRWQLRQLAMLVVVLLMVVVVVVMAAVVIVVVQLMVGRVVLVVVLVVVVLVVGRRVGRGGRRIGSVVGLKRCRIIELCQCSAGTQQTQMLNHQTQSTQQQS